MAIHEQPDFLRTPPVPPEPAVSRWHGRVAPAFDPAMAGQGHDVDLLALLQTLIRAWRLMLAGLLAGLLGGLLVAILLPRHWTSQAVVVAPETDMLQGLQTVSARMSVAGLTPEVNADWLYAQFLQAFSARDGQTAFIAAVPQVRAATAGMAPEARQRLADLLADGMTLTTAETDKKGGLPYARVTLQARADSPEGAQALLAGWLQVAGAQVAARARTALAVQRDGALDVARGRLALMLRQAAAHRDVQVNRLSHALQLARAAGISRPLWAQGYTLRDDPDFPVSLGVSGLTEKLALLKNDTDLSALSTSLRDQQLQVQQLAALSTDGLSVQPYRLLSSPSWPLRPDGPGRALLMLLSVLLSLMLTAGIILLRDALRARDTQPAYHPDTRGTASADIPEGE